MINPVTGFEVGRFSGMEKVAFKAINAAMKIPGLLGNELMGAGRMLLAPVSTLGKKTQLHRVPGIKQVVGSRVGKKATGVANLAGSLAAFDIAMAPGRFTRRTSTGLNPGYEIAKAQKAVTGGR